MNQLEDLINKNLKPFATFNYSGLWDESKFPEDPNLREELIQDQIKRDKIWNNSKKILEITVELKLEYKEEWWKGYFTETENEVGDSFYDDLNIIK